MHLPQMAYAFLQTCDSIVLQISTMLPGTLQSLRITLTFVVTTPYVSVLEQPLTYTVASFATSPKREKKSPEERLHPLHDNLRLRVCLPNHLPRAHTAQDWQQMNLLSQTSYHVTSLTPPGTPQQESMWPTQPV